MGSPLEPLYSPIWDEDMLGTDTMSRGMRGAGIKIMVLDNVHQPMRVVKTKETQHRLTGIGC